MYLQTVKCFIVLAAFGTLAAAANFSGKWAIPAIGRRPPAVLTLNQVGNEVKGSITPPRGASTGSPANTEVWAGKAEGGVVTFYLWTGLDKPVKARYQGTLKGDEIEFTITAGEAAPAKVTAKRTH